MKVDDFEFKFIIKGKDIQISDVLSYPASGLNPYERYEVTVKRRSVKMDEEDLCQTCKHCNVCHFYNQRQEAEIFDHVEFTTKKCAFYLPDEEA